MKNFKKEYQYEKTEQGIKITKYLGQNTEITIPKTIDNIPVVEIGEYAFSNNVKIVYK